MRHNAYKPIKSIGRGSFGRVDLVECLADNKQYVMKVIICQYRNLKFDNKTNKR